MSELEPVHQRSPSVLQQYDDLPADANSVRKRLLEITAGIEKIRQRPVPPCSPEHAALMTRFIVWNQEKDTLHFHLNDTWVARSIAEIVRSIRKDFCYLAQALLGLPEINSLTGTSWIIAKQPHLMEKLGFTLLGNIDETEREAHFKNETRPIAKAVIPKIKFIEKYLQNTSA